MKLALLIAVALVGVVGCGGPSAEAPVSVPSQATASSTPSATPSVAPKASTPSALTREQAGQRYLALVKPVNAVFDDPSCRESEDIFISGGTWPNDHPDRVVRACFKRFVPLSEKWIRGMQTTAWPVDARADVADLISLEQARLHCAKKASRAATYDAMAEVYAGCFAEDDGSADRVRARFGLPARPES